MAYSVYTIAGSQPIATTSTVQKHPLGTIVRGFDPTLGEGEFIYLLGATSTVVGLVYSYNATTYQTVVLPSTANLACPVAVAMSANVAASYGWYQIGGLAVVLKTAVKADPAVNGNRVYISGTSGRIMQTSAAGKCILGAARANLTTVTSTTSTVTVLINRPHVQGPIT
jgi:fructose-specific component phosphotransferase system IIB-like protein